MIELCDLTFAYPGKPPIFAGLSWSIRRDERWAVLGPSGCGKTTLLYLLAGLRRPTQGAVLVQGQRLTGTRPQTGLILQDFGLLPWATAAENVALGLTLRGVKPAPRREVVAGWLERMGLSHVAGHYPAELSGGQRQRVAIARTLALDPDLLLMDEPFAALDTMTREGLQDLVLSLNQRRAMTTVIVTHTIEEAVFLGQRILLLRRDSRRRPLVVENPWSGSLDFRSDPAFAEKCREVRSLLAEEEMCGGEYDRA
ncbi:MAG: ATP-binding cassette domain-containing protein [Chloroflexi bacterium]|nr:ATP-binding cassette domain-containing protein [Chloroflexota bacterium]